MFLVFAMLAVFAVILLTGLTQSRRSGRCRWRPDPAAPPPKGTGGLTYWRCDACGATEKTAGRRLPALCKAPPT